MFAGMLHYLLIGLGIVYAEKKLPSWKNFGLFGPFFWQKLGTWVLLSSVRVTKKNPTTV
jgi:hypothetical protein